MGPCGHSCHICPKPEDSSQTAYSAAPCTDSKVLHLQLLADLKTAARRGQGCWFCKSEGMQIVLVLTVLLQNVEAECEQGEFTRPRALRTSAPLIRSGVYVMALHTTPQGPHRLCANARSCLDSE